MCELNFEDKFIVGCNACGGAGIIENHLCENCGGTGVVYLNPKEIEEESYEI